MRIGFVSKESGGLGKEGEGYGQRMHFCGQKVKICGQRKNPLSHHDDDSDGFTDRLRI